MDARRRGLRGAQAAQGSANDIFAAASSIAALLERPLSS
jgi:hypothetical protein